MSSEDDALLESDEEEKSYTPVKRKRDKSSTEKPKKKTDTKSSPTSLQMFKRKDKPAKTSSKLEASSEVAPSGESKTQNVSEKELNDAMSSFNIEKTGDPSYAGAAKKTKMEFPYCLFIMRKISEADSSERISTKEFSNFLDYICDTRFKSDEDFEPDIEFSAYRPGFGTMACIDKKSALWVKEKIDPFNQKSASLQICAYFRWERCSAYVYSGFLHGQNWKSKKGTITLVNILKMNKIQGDFINITWDTTKPSGVYVSFEPKEALAEQLDQKMVLNTPTCKLRLTKRLRKQKSEDEHLALFERVEEDENRS